MNPTPSNAIRSASQTMAPCHKRSAMVPIAVFVHHIYGRLRLEWHTMYIPHNVHTKPFSYLAVVKALTSLYVWHMYALYRLFDKHFLQQNQILLQLCNWKLYSQQSWYWSCCDTYLSEVCIMPYVRPCECIFKKIQGVHSGMLILSMASGWKYKTCKN